MKTNNKHYFYELVKLEVDENGTISSEVGYLTLNDYDLTQLLVSIENDLSVSGGYITPIAKDTVLRIQKALRNIKEKK